MINDSLLNYIRQGRTAGMTREAITTSLTSNGWGLADVNEGFAKVDGVAAPVSQPLAQPSTPLVAKPSPSIQPAKKRWIWISAASAVVVLLLAGSAVAWYQYTLSLVSNSAPTAAQNTTPSLVVATSTTPAQNTFTFTPKSSEVPAFTLQYPATLSSSTAEETVYGARVLLGSSTTDTMTLNFSYFPNPLQPSQTAAEYLKTTFPLGTTTVTTVAGREIASVMDPHFSAGQSLYYIFLKNKSVITIEITGGDAGRDAIVQSIQFENPLY